MNHHGTIVHDYGNGYYVVEFNIHGETFLITINEKYIEIIKNNN